MFKMYWIKEMQNAIGFIEDRLLEELSVDEIAKYANSSSANFQKIFSIVTGMTVGDYIRYRRLSLAGEELLQSDMKILDIALKYGYETAESFAKAFTRFHDMVPSVARRQKLKLKIFLPLSIKIDVKGGFNLQRKLIPNVPIISYDGNNAAFFITLLETVLHSLGEECDKSKLTALSGEGNRFCWTDEAWVFGNELMDSINETPFETERRVLQAIGWKAKYITVQRDKDGDFVNTDHTQIRQDFVNAIDRGYPVIIQYIEHADCNLNVFFGYEYDGQKIVGYNYNNGFQAGVSQPIETATPIAWENWENNISGYILFQSKEKSETERSAALSLFKNISEHSRKTKEIRNKKVGFAAWDSFLHHLENDDFSGLSFEDLKSRFFIYCDGLCQIDSRNNALPYYRFLAEQFPEWQEELLVAIEKLKTCASYGGFLWQHGFTFDDNGFEKFRSFEERKHLADAGRVAMHNDVAAVKLFEEILRKEGC